jgi:hypothetical protein
MYGFLRIQLVCHAVGPIFASGSIAVPAGFQILNAVPDKASSSGSCRATRDRHASSLLGMSAICIAICRSAMSRTQSVQVSAGCNRKHGTFQFGCRCFWRRPLTHERDVISPHPATLKLKAELCHLCLRLRTSDLPPVVPDTNPSSPPAFQAQEPFCMMLQRH